MELRRKFLGVALFGLAFHIGFALAADLPVVFPAGGSNGGAPIELLTIGEPLTGSGSNVIEGLGFAYAVPPPLQIAAPTGLSISFADETSTNRLKLSWTDNSNDELGFVVERSIDGTNYTQIFVPSTTTYTDTGLATATRYFYRIKAYKAFVESDPSNSIEKYTRAAIPVNPVFSSVSQSRVAVSWDANGNPAPVTYVAELSTTQVFNVLTASTSIKISSIPYVFNGLKLNATYYFRVKAENYENIQTSYTVPVSTLTIETSPDAPSALKVAYADISGSGRLEISWVDNSDNEQGFIIERATGSSNYKWMGLLPLPLNTTIYTDTDIIDSTTYWYRVKAYNNIGESAYSNVVSTKTRITFADIGITLPGGDPSSVTWGDFDNDGDLDLAITGWGNNGKTPGVYRNDSGNMVLHFSLPDGMKSATWVDYDNDGDLDLAAAGGGVTLYRNDNSVFTATNTILPSLQEASCAWADYDNDGYLDLALMGGLLPGPVPTSRIYHNNNGSIDTSTYTALPGLKDGSVAWGDYDNDGALDLAITGSGGEGSGIYRNNLNNANNFSGSSFTFHVGLPKTSYGSITWGDYGNDGYLDLVLTGLISPGNYGISRIYHNNNGSFDTATYTALSGVSNGAAAWGDYDNDGDLDLALVGETSSTSTISTIYRNDNGAFKDIRAGLSGGKYSVAWGDYNKDNHLDLALGSSTGGAKIYQNKNGAHNSVPTRPSFDSQFYRKAGYFNPYEYLHSALLLNAIAGTDAETPPNGLRYEILVSTIDMAANPNWHGPYVVSVTSGAGIGSSPSQTSSNRPLFAFSDLPRNTTYYWKVRAVDSGMLKSEWSDQNYIYIPIHSLSYNDGNNVMTLAAEQRDVWANVVWSTDTVGAVVLATAAAQGFTTLGYIYDLRPENTAFTPPLEVTFRYSLALLPQGMTEDDIGLYHYNSVTMGMEYVNGQVKNKTDKTITASFSYLASIFVLMGRTPDTTAPLTSLNVNEESKFIDGQGNVYYSSTALVSFVAADPVINTVTSGVAYTQYRFDGSMFTTYSLPFAVPEGRHVIEYRTTDNAGNWETVKSTTVYIDTTAPVSSAVLSGTYKNGWYSSPVTVTLASTDSLSGIGQTLYSLNDTVFAPYQQPVTVSADGGYTVKYYSKDKAGNVEVEKARPFSIDQTAPQVGYTLNPQPNSYGWNRTSVEAVFKGTDILSGVDICTSSRTYVEGAGKTLSSWCRDMAGNIGYSTAVVNIDISSPVVTVFASPAANSYNWNNTPVTVAFSGSDAISGNFSCMGDRTVSSEGAEQIITGSCTDYAGNSQSAFRAVSIDMTRPATTAGLSGNIVGGWYNTAVLITLASFDALSGVNQIHYRLEWGGVVISSGVYASSVAVSVDGLYTVYYYATDKAGNAEGEKSIDFKIDRTLPQVSYTLLPAANGSAWNNTAVQVVFSGMDTLSGVVECSSKTISTEGQAQAVAGWCRDTAGNIGNFTATVNVDLTKPVSIATQNPAPNLKGWNNNNVGVTFSGSDILSGLSYCSPGKIISAEGAAQMVSGDCMDYASNTSTATLVLNIDKTAPGILISSPAAGNYFVATKNKIVASYAVTDNLDPAPNMTAMLRQIEDRGSPKGARPAAIVVVNGQQIEPLDIDDGIWRLIANATDFADNISSASGGLFEVVHDVLPPRTALAAGGGSYQGSGQALYVTGRTTFTLTSIDDLVAVSDSIGLGVKKQAMGVSAEGRGLLRELVFENTAPVQGAAFTSAFKLDQETDGAYNLAYNSEDVLANVEKIKISTFIVDNTAPQTTFSRVSGPAYLTYVSTWTLFELAPTDPGAFASGVKETAYSINSGAIATSPLKFLLPGADGNYLVKYRSRDNLENLEVEKSSQVFVDAAPPFSALDVIGGKQYPSAEPGSFYASLATKFGFIAVDPVVSDGAAGVKAIEHADNGGTSSVYAQPISLVEGKHLVTYRATDRVENTEVFRSTQIYIDNTAPVTSFSIAGPLYLKDGIRYITPESGLTFASADPLVSEVSAGVERIETAVDGGQWLKYTQALKFAEGRHTIKYRAIDNVGNVEAERVLEVLSDATPPVTAHHIGVPYYISGAGVNYITPETPLTFSASDPITSEVASGVERIETAVDGGAYALYTAALKFPEGRHTIKYRAYDNVGNLEVAQTLEVQSDSTAPESRWLAASGPWIEKDNKFYLNAFGSIALESADPVRNNVASGLENIYYGIDAAPAVKYLAALSLAEGVRTVNYSAKDNLGNTELVKSTVVYVDGTKPATELSLSGDQYNGDKQYISQRTDIIITAADPAVNSVAVGVKDTKYSVDGGAFANYSLFKLSAEGQRLVSYYSTDYVANTEAVKTTALWVDNTPPATELTIAGARYSAPGDEKLYITSDSGIVLTSSDPVSNDTASGLMLTKYKLDGGNWLVYSGGFTIAAEGLHTLEYYALDRVQNAETLRAAKIAVDNTPPVSRLASGRPKYELDGYTLVSPATLLTLEAADPLSGGIASGVSGIYYSLGASPAVPYFTPFALTNRGLNTLRWWSVDNVQNTESAHTAVYELDNEAPVLKLACPGESFSGICNIYNSTFTVYGTVSDKYMKSWRLEYAPGADAQGGYLPVSSGSVSITTGAIGLLNPAGLAGAYTLRLSAADLVENAAVKQVNIRIGRPSVQLSLGGHRVLNKPEAVAVDGEGRLYIADTNNDRLALYTSTGGFIRYYGGDDDDDDKRGKRDTAPRFNKPGAVALAGNNIYVSDTNNNRVVKISSAGEVLLAIGGRVRGEDDDDDDKKVPGTADPLRLDKPRGLAVDAAGDLYVADSGNNRVLKLDPAGKELMRIILPAIVKNEHDDDDDDGDEDAAAGPGKPQGLALDGAGNIYITDPAGGRVLIYDALGGLLSQVKAFKKPHGIAVSPDAECLLIADAKTGGVYKLDRNKAVNLGFGAKAGENNDDDGDEDDDGNERNDPLSLKFNKPGLLAFGADGSLYLADRNNNRVVKLGLPAAAPLVIDGRKGGKNRTSAALAVQGNLIAPLAGPDPSFRLGEVYVFPNPAKGGEAPVFHIETGIADSVKITIYTISGRAAHEQTLTGMPAELDDGKGLSYAYEYTWRGHIPSGVYLYHIEAQKAGQKLKKTGKFAIVR